MCQCLISSVLSVAKCYLLTEVPDVPHGVDDGVMFVKDDEERRGSDTVCQCLTVQILSGETSEISNQFNSSRTIRGAFQS